MDPQVAINRVLRLTRLDTTVFEEARDDPAFTIPAIAVAAIAFLLAGIGGWLWWWAEGFPDKAKLLWESVLLGTLFATGMWVAWVGIAWLILVNVFHYSANFERMLRSCGLAVLPAAIGFFMFIPGINIGIGIASFGLMFLLMDIGIQVSVDAQPGHVILAAFAGFVAFALVLSLLAMESDYLAPGVFLFKPINSYASHAYHNGASSSAASGRNTLQAICRGLSAAARKAAPECVGVK
ncbi:MAG: hypothetical protein ACYDCQ_11525 [Dehalococcoidia bacterium]